MSNNAHRVVAQRLQSFHGRGGTVAAVRLGCSGCLSTVVSFLAVGLFIGAVVWGVARTLEAPAVAPIAFGPQDGVRAQQKIFGLARRSARGEHVTLTEAEINAFVARHLDPYDLPLREPVIRLRGDDTVEITGHLPRRRLLVESPLGSVVDVLPSAWLERPIWLTVVAHTRVETEPRRVLRLDARRVVIGRQRVPTFLLRLTLDPTSLRLTRISLPGQVQAVRIERGQVLIQTTASPGRT